MNVDKIASFKVLWAKRTLNFVGRFGDRGTVGLCLGLFILMRPDSVKIKTFRVPKAQVAIRTWDPFEFDDLVVVLVTVFVQIQHVFVTSCTKVT